MLKSLGDRAHESLYLVIMRRPIAIETTQKLKAALSLARARISGSAGGIGLAALLVFASFILLAILAPIALQLPPILKDILGYLPFLALLGGIFIATRVLFRLGKAEAKESTESEFAGTIAKAAYHEAMNIAEDCGLKSKTAREYSNCLSGQVGDNKLAIFVIAGEVYALLRLKSPIQGFAMIAPMGKDWPFEYKNSAKLAPFEIPLELGARGWSFDNLSARDLAHSFVQSILPALNMSKIGGQIPFLWAEERNVVLKWNSNDIGACTLIASEIANAIKN